MNENKPEKTTMILVNGQEKIVAKDDISYEDIVKLAFGEYVESDQTIYTVLYFKGQSGKPKGELVKGETLKVHIDGLLLMILK